MQEWFARVQLAGERVRSTGSTCTEEDVFLKILGGLPEELRPLQMVLGALPNLGLEEMQAVPVLRRMRVTLHYSEIMAIGEARELVVETAMAATTSVQPGS